MKRLFLVGLFITLILLLMNSAMLGFAQDEESCPTGEWVAVAAEIYVAYPDIMQAEMSNELERAAALQHLRRCLDAAPRDADNDEAYTLLQNTLNLTVDSIISAELGQDEVATNLMDLANAQYAEVGSIIIQTPVGGQPVIITYPADGSTLLSPIQVVGTYDASLLDENNPIWLYVFIGRVYVQAVNQCSGDQREPIPYARFNNSWAMDVGLGGTGDNGRVFSLILVKVNSEMNDFLNEKNEEWCASGNFEGLTQDEAFPESGSGRSVTVLQVVNVTRQGP